MERNILRVAAGDVPGHCGNTVGARSLGFGLIGFNLVCCGLLGSNAFVGLMALVGSVALASEEASPEATCEEEASPEDVPNANANANTILTPVKDASPTQEEASREATWEEKASPEDVSNANANATLQTATPSVKEADAEQSREDVLALILTPSMRPNLDVTPLTRTASAEVTLNVDVAGDVIVPPGRKNIEQSKS